MNDKILITVIVPVFNHWDIVPSLMERIDRQSLDKKKFELLVVDNASDIIMNKFTWPVWARLMTCTTPGSYAARNTAIRSARGKLLAFTDADCLPDSDWLENGLEYFNRYHSEKRIFAGGIKVLPQNFKHMTRSEVFDVVMGLPQERYVKRGYGVTANLMIPANAFEEVGLFDESRFSGGDAEFCRRALSNGWKLEYCPLASVVHPARREWKELKTKQQRIKGGQLKSGPASRRIMFAVISFVPPFRQFYFALKSSHLSFWHRLSVCATWCRLWIVGLSEVLRLLCGGQPERR